MTEQDRPNPAEAAAKGPLGAPEPQTSPRSEAQAAELAALEAMLPGGPAVPEVAPDAVAGERPAAGEATQDTC